MEYLGNWLFGREGARAVTLSSQVLLALSLALVYLEPSPDLPTKQPLYILSTVMNRRKHTVQ